MPVEWILQQAMKWQGDGCASDAQGSKALVVGDARAFLSMYQALAAAGQRAVQLDRVLQSAPADAATIAEVRPLQMPPLQCILTLQQVDVYYCSLMLQMLSLQLGCSTC